MEALQQLAMNIFLIAIPPLLFLLASVVFSKSGALRRKLPYPPGPKGLPIIGNMLLMSQLTHRGLAKLAKKHGNNTGILHLKMGRLHMICVSSPDIAQQVLQAQDNSFSDKPATIAITYLTYNRADMVFAPYGPFWRRMRKLCVMKLFSRKRVESWVSVRDEVDAIVKTAASSQGKALNVGELVFTWTMNIIYRAAFGSKNIGGEQQEEFGRILQEFSKLFGAFNVADFIPWLRWFDPQGLNSRLVNARTSLDVFIDLIIDQHIHKNNNQYHENINSTQGRPCA